jgi:hypothetical protein
VEKERVPRRRSPSRAKRICASRGAAPKTFLLAPRGGALPHRRPYDYRGFPLIAGTQPHVEPLDTNVAIETPEHIVFRYRVAGPARRLLAYVVDLIVVYTAFFLF